MKQANTVFLGIGSNINKRDNIFSCLQYFYNSFKHCNQSPIYQSAAFGFNGHDFYNLVIEIKTQFNIVAMKRWLMTIEDNHGRDRTQKRYSNRTLDIDILLFNDEIIQHDGIIIPRPEILKQAYVLKPLADIAGDRQHPITKKTFLHHWQMFDNNQQTITVVDM